jgi:hypothetical protein
MALFASFVDAARPRDARAWHVRGTRAAADARIARDEARASGWIVDRVLYTGSHTTAFAW